MMTTLVTLIQNAERETAATDRHPTGRFVPRERALTAVARRLMERWTRRGFRSRTRMSSVSVPGVDFRSGRSSSV
jgi:hypothetical protein